MTTNIADRYLYLNRGGGFSLGIPLRPNDIVISFLTNSANENNMNVDGSVSFDLFNYTVPNSKMLLLGQYYHHVEDLNILPSKFAGQNALSNGISLTIIDTTSTVLLDLFGNVTITHNAAFSHLVGTDLLTDPGPGSDSFAATFDFRSLYKTALILNTGETIEMKVQDDLTGLSEMHGVIHGQLIDNTNP